MPDKATRHLQYLRYLPWLILFLALSAPSAQPQPSPITPQYIQACGTGILTACNEAVTRLKAECQNPTATNTTCGAELPLVQQAADAASAMAANCDSNLSGSDCSKALNQMASSQARLSQYLSTHPLNLPAAPPPAPPPADVTPRMLAIAAQLICNGAGCDNETIAESDHGLAPRWREVITEKIASGMSDAQVLDDMLRSTLNLVRLRPKPNARIFGHVRVSLHSSMRQDRAGGVKVDIRGDFDDNFEFELTPTEILYPPPADNILIVPGTFNYSGHLANDVPQYGQDINDRPLFYKRDCTLATQGNVPGKITLSDWSGLDFMISAGETSLRERHVGRTCQESGRGFGEFMPQAAARLPKTLFRGSAPDVHLTAACDPGVAPVTGCRVYNFSGTVPSPRLGCLLPQGCWETWDVDIRVTPLVPISPTCSNTAETGCALYQDCFNRYCHCPGQDNYFISYGAKYCGIFLGTEGWTPAGAAWRDNVLHCLQEKIVPRLPLDAPDTCNCAEMKDYAFHTHVECYTQQPHSVCSLPLSDLKKIYSAINLKDLFGTSEGLTQALAVAAVCQAQNDPTGFFSELLQAAAPFRR